MRSSVGRSSASAFPVILPLGTLLLHVVAGDKMAITEFVGGMAESLR